MKKFILIISVLISTPIIMAWVSDPIEHYELSSFISPDTCGGCHDEIFQQWKGSMHNMSLTDRIYVTAAIDGLKGLNNKEETEEAELCQKCHTPMGFITGYPMKTSDSISKIPEIAGQGIQCDYCHSITGAKAIFNAQYKYSPGKGDEDPGIKRGPFRDSVSDFHKTEYSGFHTRSEFCGTCHDVKHVVFGTWLETTYQEWSKSQYSKSGIQCQDCHMYQRPGHPATGSTPRDKNPGSAASGSIKREHIFTHYFAGGNTAVPLLTKNKTLAKMAGDRLKNAVDIRIDPKPDGDKIVIRLLNNGAGHEVPTGLTNVRQAWLKVVIKDNKGKIIYKTGVPDSKGYIDKNSIIYNTVFGDGKGKPVDNVAKAREVLKNNRLKPMQERVEKIDAGRFNGKITVEASLLYRSMSQELADSLKGLKGIKIPVTVMKEVKGTVEK